MRSQKWYENVYRVFWNIFNAFIPRKYALEREIVDIEQTPYIVVSNHHTTQDPILVGMGFKKHMYFVASDQVMRDGIKGRMINFLAAPIPLVKSANEIQTVIAMLKKIKSNANICIFAEGTVSPDGDTHEIKAAIGKLIKRSGASLVTYRLSGGYFTRPRWARFIRKGKMTGKIVQVYSPEELAGMSAVEINEAISRDIYVNAYDDQAKNPIAYRGKKLAECLETVLYCCPVCGHFSTLASRNDRLFCTCGFHVRYTEYGYFEYPNPQNEKPPFTTILDWSKWQRNKLAELAEKSLVMDKNSPIFTDSNQRLFLIKRANRGDLQGKGSLLMYNDRLAFATDSGKSFEFPLETIIDMAIFANSVLIFSTKDKLSYEVKSKQPLCALKYIEIFKLMRRSS